MEKLDMNNINFNSKFNLFQNTTYFFTAA